MKNKIIKTSYTMGASVFIIKVFPELEIIQLPDIYANSSDITHRLYSKNINFFFLTTLSKQELQRAFYSFNSNMLALKFPSSYLIMPLNMIDLLEILKEIERLKNLKAFW